MTKNITTAAAPATLTEQIDHMLMTCSDYGVGLHAADAAELLSDIDDAEVTAQALEEMARLIRLHGETAVRKAA